MFEIENIPIGDVNGKLWKSIIIRKLNKATFMLYFDVLLKVTNLNKNP